VTAVSVSIHSLRGAFAGEVSGLHITKPISAADVSAIEAGMDAYAVLVFRDQHLTDEQQIAFTLNFGELENYQGRIIPSWGANTEFADMRGAYDALDARTKAEVAGLICEHSLIYSREAIGFGDLTPEEITAFAPVRHPLVRRHPVTGRPSLFLSAHAGGIVGRTVPEARMFLRDLTEHATQREFVYSHAWKPGDLVMWDNRATMHRARRFDHSEVRDVRRTTLAGDPPIVATAHVA
jgi:alpha-ketoglutarate-dependent taurine dioxygenase